MPLGFDDLLALTVRHFPAALRHAGKNTVGSAKPTFPFSTALHMYSAASRRAMRAASLEGYLSQSISYSFNHLKSSSVNVNSPVIFSSSIHLLGRPSL